MRFCLILITALFLAGCSHHKAPPPNARLSDSITVIAGLNDQLQSWHGTPYRYGGMTRRGVDCFGICGCNDARSFRFAAAPRNQRTSLYRHAN